VHRDNLLEILLITDLLTTANTAIKTIDVRNGRFMILQYRNIL